MTRRSSSLQPIMVRVTAKAASGASRRRDRNLSDILRGTAFDKTARSATGRGRGSDRRKHRHPSHDPRCRWREAPLRLDGRSLIERVECFGVYPAPIYERSRLRRLARPRSKICRQSAPRASNERGRRFGLRRPRGTIRATRRPGTCSAWTWAARRCALRRMCKSAFAIRANLKSVKSRPGSTSNLCAWVLSTSRSAPLTVAVVVNGSRGRRHRVVSST